MKKHRKCKINESFGVDEILLFLLFFYLFNETKLNFIVQFLTLKFFANRFKLKTLLNEKFN